MGRFVLGRVVQGGIVLLVMSFVVYSLIGLMPGDPIDVMIAGNPGATPETIAHLRHIYGLDQPLLLRYGHWLLNAAIGDFGFSRVHSRPVLEVLAPALLQTCQLIAASFILAVILSFALGILAALRPGGIVDGLISLFAFAGISVPVFWLALMMILIFAVELHWLPASGIATVGDGSLMDHVRHLVMPEDIGNGQHRGIHPLRARRHDREFADGSCAHRAEGAGERRVVLVHAFRNALIPVVTVMALNFGALFGGALLTETIYAQPRDGKDDLQLDPGQ